MKLKDYFDNPFEIFWGACSQFPIILIVGWWAPVVMLFCGLLWRLGGVAGGNHLFRRIGVPLVVCGATFLVLHQLIIFAAVPFMILFCPASYGEDSWLFKYVKSVAKDQKKSDLITRLILLAWYWSSFSLFLLF